MFHRKIVSYNPNPSCWIRTPPQPPQDHHRERSEHQHRAHFRRPPHVLRASQIHGHRGCDHEHRRQPSQHRTHFRAGSVSRYSKARQEKRKIAHKQHGEHRHDPCRVRHGPPSRLHSPEPPQRFSDPHVIPALFRHQPCQFRDHQRYRQAPHQWRGQGQHDRPASAGCSDQRFQSERAPARCEENQRRQGQHLQPPFSRQPHSFTCYFSQQRARRRRSQGQGHTPECAGRVRPKPSPSHANSFLSHFSPPRRAASNPPAVRLLISDILFSLHVPREKPTRLLRARPPPRLRHRRPPSRASPFLPSPQPPHVRLRLDRRRLAHRPRAFRPSRRRPHPRRYPHIRSPRTSLSRRNLGHQQHRRLRLGPRCALRPPYPQPCRPFSLLPRLLAHRQSHLHSLLRQRPAHCP